MRFIYARMGWRGSLQRADHMMERGMAIGG